MSFRYGQEVADVAKAMISGAIDVKGNPTIDSKVDVVDQDQKHTRIYRTNGALLLDAVGLIGKGFKIKCEINVWDLVNMLKSADALFNLDVKNVKHESIIPYSTWDDLMDCCDEDPELNRIAKIVISDKVDVYVDRLTKMAKEKIGNRYDILLTTAHKSKGLQWDHVILANDFHDLDEGFEGLGDQERNLIYVAATRAVKTLELPVDMQAAIEKGDTDVTA